MEEFTADDRVETFPTLDLETWVVASESQHEIQEKESGGEANIEDNANNNVQQKVAMDEKTVTDGAEVLPTIVPETSAIVPESEHKTGEMEGGGEEMRVEANAYRGTVANKEAKNKATIEFDEEPDSGKKGRTRIQFGRKPTRTRVDQLGPTQLKTGRKRI